MVLVTMTFYEMYENFASDYLKIKYLREKYTPTAITKFKRTLRFPAWEIFEYTIPSSRNSYVLYFYARDRSMVEYPSFNFFAVVFDNNRRFVVTWGCSPYRHTEGAPMIATRRIDAYSSHFFQRYRERCLKNSAMSVNEVVCRYLTRNPNALLMELNEDIKKDFQKYGDTAKYGMRVNDGICLVRSAIEGKVDVESNKERVDALGFVYVTFIDDNTLHLTQQKAVLKENIRYSQVLLKGLIKDLN